MDLQKENNIFKDKITDRRKNIQSLNNRIEKLVNMPFKLSEFDKIMKFNQESLEKFYDNQIDE